MIGPERLGMDQVNAYLRERAEEQKSNHVYYFGFDIRNTLLEDARQYVPFLNYLERSTGYRFKLRFTAEGGSLVDDLGRGRVHFASVGAVSYIQLQENYGGYSIARGVNRHGKTSYQSFIVVAPDSAVEKIDDLVGRRFAFGDVTSTQGHLIPHIILAEHGVELSDLKKYSYTGSHARCADAVISRQFDACGMQDTLALDMAGKGLLKILFKSRDYPSSGIAANRDVPEEVRERVQKSLLAFDPKGADAKGLHHWHLTEMPRGFQTGNEADYDNLRSWLKKLDLLQR